jgi:tetratricopeptide (TPR) repeat protein
MVLYRLGLTYYAYQKYKKSVTTFKQALNNKPYAAFEADIYYHIGLGYARVEKFEKSIYPFTACVERIPDDIRFTHERAKAYQMIEMHDKAVEDFNVVIQRNPKNAHAHFRRAFSLKSLKVSYTRCFLIGLEIR